MIFTPTTCIFLTRACPGTHKLGHRGQAHGGAHLKLRRQLVRLQFWSISKLRSMNTSSRLVTVSHCHSGAGGCAFRLDRSKPDSEGGDGGRGGSEALSFQAGLPGRVALFPRGSSLAHGCVRACVHVCLQLQWQGTARAGPSRPKQCTHQIVPK